MIMSEYDKGVDFGIRLCIASVTGKLEANCQYADKLDLGKEIKTLSDVLEALKKLQKKGWNK